MPAVIVASPIIVVLVVVLYLALLFVIGYAEMRFLKSRSAAATTWLLGIGALSVLVAELHKRADPVLGVCVFVSGIAAIAFFFWKRRG